VKKSASLRLILDAHTSIAFLAAVLDLKSGVQTEGPRRSRDLADRRRFGRQRRALRHHRRASWSRGDVAIAISVSQPAAAQARAYVRKQLPDVGTLISFAIPTGPGQQSVTGGERAAVLAEQVSNHLRIVKADDPDAVSIFSRHAQTASCSSSASITRALSPVSFMNSILTGGRTRSTSRPSSSTEAGDTVSRFARTTGAAIGVQKGRMRTFSYCT
jgi:hypothetical protein